MNKTSTFLIHNLWWLVPLAVVLLFWQHTAPILLMLVFAYLGRVILNPIVSAMEKRTGSRKWSVFIIMGLLIVFLSMLSSSLFPLISRQIAAFQTALTMDTLTKFMFRFTTIMENILPAFIFNLFRMIPVSCFKSSNFSSVYSAIFL